MTSPAPPARAGLVLRSGRRVLAGLGILVVTAACAAGPPPARNAPGRSPAGSPAGPGASSAPAVAGRGPGMAPSGPGGVLEVSHGCHGQNAEVEQSVDLPYVYELWIGCGGIGFARSADGGRSFDPPVRVPGSAGSGFAHVDGRYLPRGGWDPAIAVAPGGTVYVSYMVFRQGYDHPRIAVSADHGGSFAHVYSAMPPAGARNNWGDRDFIAVSGSGTIYLTWDYGPALRSPDANIVLQKSTDDGRTWSRITPVSPGYPDHGGDVAGPVLAGSGSRVEVLLWALYNQGQHGYALPPGHDYFTSSADGGRTWSSPDAVGPAAGEITGVSVTWIDTAIGRDSGGDLYATWDTQRPGGDIGWLSWSADHGRTWSPALRVTEDHDRAEHIMAVAGGRRGVAYVGWLSDNSHLGFAPYLRVFAVRRGWLSGPIRVSSQHGNRTVWPGDTIGISVLPGRPRVMLSWGSAVGGLTSQIWVKTVVP